MEFFAVVKCVQKLFKVKVEPTRSSLRQSIFSFSEDGGNFKAFA